MLGLVGKSKASKVRYCRILRNGILSINRKYHTLYIPRQYFRNFCICAPFSTSKESKKRKCLHITVSFCVKGPPVNAQYLEFTCNYVYYQYILNDIDDRININVLN